MDKKNQTKAGIIFGTVMTAFFFLQTLFTSDNLGAKNILISLIVAVFCGALAGILYAWTVGKFGRSGWIDNQTRITTEPGESILFDTPANHFKGIEGVGGKLYLTNKRLVFKSHKINFQKHQLSINLSDIQKVDRYKPLGIANNGLLIKTADNKIEKFVVEKREAWMEQMCENNSLQLG